MSGESAIFEQFQRLAEHDPQAILRDFIVYAGEFQVCMSVMSRGQEFCRLAQTFISLLLCASGDYKTRIIVRGMSS